MSSLDPVVGADDVLHRAAVKSLIDGERPSDAWLIKLGDWFSPILVKEVRQALKSRQFNWTLILLMICIGVWTGFVVLSLMPGIYFFPSGRSLLAGYFFILLIPTILVVPNSAYRSMASELEQGTFDVLSITPLSPFKIVLGKMAVAMVQSLIFFSALAPCMTMSYLLRGVPLPSIALLLGWAAVSSFAISAVGIMLGTWNRFGNYGTILSILMIAASVSAIIGLEIVFAALAGEFTFVDWEIVFANVIAWTMVSGYGGLLLLTAAAAIGVAGENYSTRIRWWLFGMSLLIVVWLAMGIGLFSDTSTQGIKVESEAFGVLCVCLGLHWGAAGMFLIGERGVAGPRAQRSLPNTLLGRVFLSWTSPGSGTGYIFSLLSYAGCAVGVSVGGSARFVSDNDVYILFQVVVLILVYLVVYLGLTRLCLLVTGLFPSLIGSRMVMSPCFAILFLLSGTLFPLLVSGFLNGNGEPSFEWYTVINPFWTLSEAFSKSIDPLGWFFILVLGAAVFSVNFATLSRDVTLVRVEAPPKVRQELESETESA